MAIRVGVDVGGTFTKAVALDTDTLAIVAEAIVPTTHDHPDGTAAGIVDVVRQLAGSVGADRVELVTHSTTQAVNALLEGDVATVGMIGMGRSPDLRKARRRTIVPRIVLSADRSLTTLSEFVDVSHGLDDAAADAVVGRLKRAGAQAIAVAEAFAPDDQRNERTVAAAAARAGLPATASTDLTGLYGLELRSVSAALNASIVPIALRTADLVMRGVADAGITGPLLVMRGDGGATDLDGFRTAPARTLYSGPAASVAGALRSGRIGDAIIVEVGGTSSNIAAVRRGRPMLSYVRVASHATAIRAVDVRVVGVAGGSMLRTRRRRVYGVGPRSAHIAGLAYACYLTEDRFERADVEVIAPRPADPADYLVVRLADGTRTALTNTCAANALGLVEAGDYATGDRLAARAAFAVAGRYLGLPGDEVARRMLQASTQALGDVITAACREHQIDRPVLVAVGGGAGGLGRAVATALRLELVIPAHAEIISAVGDALSLIRTERERTFDEVTAAGTEELIADVEDEAMRAGAAESSLDVRVTQNIERRAVRVTVTGAVALAAGRVPGRDVATSEQMSVVARQEGHADVAAIGVHWLARGGRRGRVALYDRYGDLIVDVRGEALIAPNADTLAAAVTRHTRRVGPVLSPPVAWLVTGPRVIELDLRDSGTRAPDGAAPTTRSDAMVIIGRD